MGAGAISSNNNPKAQRGDAVGLQICTVKLEGKTPLLFGKQVDREEFPKEAKEGDDDYEKRTWRERTHFEMDGNGGEDGPLYVPARAFKKLLENTAKYKSEKIKGKGNRTWTANFKAGISVEADMVLDPPVLKSEVKGMWRSVPSDGKPGGAKRVKRCFPIVAPPWKGEIRIMLIDPQIKKDKVEEYLREGGMLNGLGMWRPQNGGSYGRFAVKSVEWEEVEF